MLVLCGWTSPRAIGTTVVKCRSLETLPEEFNAKMCELVRKWDAEMDRIIRSDKYGPNYDEPMWARPAGARMTWFYPQSPSVQ